MSESHNLQTYANFGVIHAFTEVVHALRERNKANNAVAVARRSAFTETNSFEWVAALERDDRFLNKKPQGARNFSNLTVPNNTWLATLEAN